ncbi:hypothetical protein H7X46_22540 [Pseudonocardia sp. C8]|nr:hypothetical protein [Pseudonocardia sp. C8]
MTPEQRRERASLAARTRHRGPDDPSVDDDRRRFAVDRLADHIREVVESAPAPTAEQIERLRGLLPSLHRPL